MNSARKISEYCLWLLVSGSLVFCFLPVAASLLRLSGNGLSDITLRLSPWFIVLGAIGMVYAIKTRNLVMACVSGGLASTALVSLVGMF